MAQKEKNTERTQKMKGEPRDTPTYLQPTGVLQIRKEHKKERRISSENDAQEPKHQ